MRASSVFPATRSLKPLFAVLGGIAFILGIWLASSVGGLALFSPVGAAILLIVLSAILFREVLIQRTGIKQAKMFAMRLRELEEANRLLKLTETTAKVGHWRLELANNEVYWSDGCFAIHGFEPGEPGLPPPLDEAIEYFHPDDRSIVDNAVETSRATGEPFIFRARLIRADGSVRHTMSTALVEFDDDGNASALFGVFCDRTEEELMQRELRAARENADALADARKSFLAKMSHEIRTPMNGILGFAELLSDSSLDDEQSRHVDLIRDSGKTLQTILNDILDLSKVEEGHIELREDTTDIAHLVTKVTRLSMPAAQEKNLSLLHSISQDVPRYVRLDGLRLRQILSNIIANAVRFTDAGSVELEVSASADTLKFAVSDTGIGIPKELHQAIFDPFAQDTERPSSRRGGTGLGMAISRQLAELMGGTLTVESATGHGSTFTLTLPLVLAPAPVDVPSVEIAPPINPCAGCTCRILLAEDFDINQELIRDQGRKLGLTFEVVENGEEAVAAVIEAREAMRPYSMVLMDLQMPKLGGLEAASAIREAGFGADDLPIIALTANAFSDDVEACLAAGMQEHIAKPLELARLRDVMRKWLKGYVLQSADASAGSGTTAIIANDARRRTCQLHR